jgi:hypothetical protein
LKKDFKKIINNLKTSAMEKKVLKRKITLTETQVEENTSFEITGKGSYHGKLESGSLAKNAGSIIVDGQSGIAGKIPGITNIWLTANNDCTKNNYTIHVRDRSPKGKENINLTFFDDGWNVYKMIIYPYSEEQIHILHYNSNYGNIIRMRWDF